MWDEEADSARIKTKATKTMAERDTEFTNIEILYDMNLLLLNDEQRFSSGWGDDANQSFSEHKTQRPSDQYLENLYQELKLFWDGILLALPSSTESGSAMRNHNYDEDKNPGDLTDDLWFWPIGQLLIIKVARHLLHNLLSPGMPITAEAVNAALSPLSRIPTNLHEAPWRYFALTQGQNKKDGSWTFKMRSEDRVRAMTLGETIAKFIIGTGPSLNHDDIHGPNGIKTLWDGMLISAPITPEEVNGMWHQIETLKLTYQSRVTI
jgi:hypothetical protein